ncbi:hypothetical protein BGX23_006020 [Mortierella sp. AD031]|nr:hypothetical protein BGX23_006020 [Mortierella sp. AD031]
MVETNPDTDTYFQAFRSETEQRDILIPVVRHPTLGQLYVIWTDITDCFPRATRVQCNDAFVPFMRDDNLARAKPYGVRYHPGVVLEVILAETPPASRRNTNGRNRNSSSRNQHAHASSVARPVGGTGPAIGGVSKAASQQTGSSHGHTAKGGDVSGDTDGTHHKTKEEEEAKSSSSGTLANGSTPQSVVIKAQPTSSKEQPHTRLTAGLSMHQTTVPTHMPATDDGKNWLSIAESYSSTLPHTRPKRPGPLDFIDVVETRVDTIVRDRFSWTKSGYPRFYCFLPILSGPGPTPTADGAPVVDDVIRSDTKFQLYYLCDCGDIPGYEGRWYPHWTIKEGEHYLNNATGESTSLEQMEDIIPLVGTFVVAVLEMLKSGAYIDDVLRVPPQTDPIALRRISLAIQYFEAKGIRSCDRYWRNLKAGVRGQVFTSIISVYHEDSVEFWRIAEKNRWVRLSELLPYKTTEGDVRYLCQAHWHAMTPQDLIHQAMEFSNNPMSAKSEYRIAQGAFVSEVLSMQRAREYFQLAAQMTSTTVLRISLDWDLTPGDEDELCLLIGRLSASALHITVRRKTRCASGALLGFASGYVPLTLGAIWNPNIEIFMLLPRPPADEPDYSAYYERHYMISSCDSLSSDTIATLMKPAKGKQARAILHASDIDLAVNSIRRLAKGFQHFSELQLTKESIQPNAIIRFRHMDECIPIPEDTEYASGDLFGFFERREWIDEVECDCHEAAISQLLLLQNLTRVVVWFSLKQDRVKIRELIKVNKKLKELTLHDTERDDPSQIFETYKALLANHPLIELFEVRQHHIDTADSTFAWKNPKDPLRMRVGITCYAGDKIQSMLQKYTPLIDSLTIEHLKPSDAAVLEKSTRPKKGPLALRWLGIHNVHLMETAVLDDLKKVILRSDIEQVVVAGSTFKAAILLDDGTTLTGPETPARKAIKKIPGKKRDDVAEEKANVGVWADFIMAIRTKLTDMSVSTKDPANLLDALESHVVEGEQADMIQLQGFTITGAWTQSILLYPWMERLLLSTGHGATARYLADGRRKQILTKLTMTGSLILEEDWRRILQSLDLFQMTRIHIRQKNRLTIGTLRSMIEAIPMNSPLLRQYLVDDGQVISTEISKALEVKMKTKSEKFRTTVILQSLHMA